MNIYNIIHLLIIFVSINILSMIFFFDGYESVFSEDNLVPILIFIGYLEKRFNIYENIGTPKYLTIINFSVITISLYISSFLIDEKLDWYNTGYILFILGMYFLHFLYEHYHQKEKKVSLETNN